VHHGQEGVIERHQLSSSDLRAKVDVWENVKEVLEQCKSDTFKSQIQSTAKTTTVPYYDIYERNGEVCLKDLKEVNGETPEAARINLYDRFEHISALVLTDEAGKEHRP